MAFFLAGGESFGKSRAREAWLRVLLLFPQFNNKKKQNPLRNLSGFLFRVYYQASNTRLIFTLLGPWNFLDSFLVTLI